MNTSELVYEGELRTTAIHVYSGTKIFTDAPLDNQGKAQSFSPTDLVATALGCCMMTIMGIEANKQNINLEGTKISVIKIMASNPRRISKIEVKFEIPERLLTIEQKVELENLAKNCPVAKSIHAEIDQVITFVYV
jgi:putative redox protein